MGDSSGEDLSYDHDCERAHEARLALGKKPAPSYINNMMFEPFVEHNGELINVNTIERCYRTVAFTMVYYKGREKKVEYHASLYPLILAKLGL